MTHNVDLRIKRTRKLLRDALVELIDEKGFDAITVQDIATHAMINRATFYRHFVDKHELLARSMEDVWSDLASKLDPPPYDTRHIGPHEPPYNLVLLFEHVEEHANFYRVMLGKWQVPAFAERTRSYLGAIAQERIEMVLPLHRPSPVPRTLISSVAIDMALSMIRWWVENHFPCTAEDMARHYVILSIFGIYRAMGVHQPDWPG